MATQRIDTRISLETQFYIIFCLTLSEGFLSDSHKVSFNIFQNDRNVVSDTEKFEIGGRFHFPPLGERL